MVNWGINAGVKPRLHHGNMLPGNMCPVAVNMFLVSATKLLPVCCQSVAGYKSTVT